MYSDCKTSALIRIEDLFDGRMQVYGIGERVVPGKTKSDHRCLCDGVSCIWVTGYPYVCHIEYREHPSLIHLFDSLGKEFDTDFYDLWDPRYWGYDSQEEMKAGIEADAKNRKVAYMRDVISSVVGEQREIDPRIEESVHVRVGRVLVAKCPDLASPERRKDLVTALTELEDVLKKDSTPDDKSLPF